MRGKSIAWVLGSILAGRIYSLVFGSRNFTSPPSAQRNPQVLLDISALRVRSKGQLLVPASQPLSTTVPTYQWDRWTRLCRMGIPVIPVDAGCPAVVPPSDGIDSLILEQPESLVSIPLHPCGVKPSGNQYTAHSNARHAVGFFQILPDEVLATVLEYLDATQLGLLGSCCKFLYAFSRSDDLWKTLFIE